MLNNKKLTIKALSGITDLEFGIENEKERSWFQKGSLWVMTSLLTNRFRYALEARSLMLLLPAPISAWCVCVVVCSQLFSRLDQCVAFIIWAEKHLTVTHFCDELV